MSRTPLIVTPAHGPDIEVQTTLQDTLEFEQFLRKNRRLGDLKENALKLQPFKAFNALRREGRLPEGVESWDDFTTGSTAVVEVRFKDEDDDDEAGDKAGQDDGSLEVEGLGEAGQSVPSTD